MSQRGIVRGALKRGALLTAANWQVVVVQAVADAVFKLLIVIPIMGGVLLVALVGDLDLAGLLASDLQVAIETVARTLSGRPGALAAFAVALSLVLVGGAVLTFLVKAGSVSIVVAADRAAGPIERPPLRLAYVQRAMQFSIEAFMEGARALFRRFVALGLWLLLGYGLTAAAYAVVNIQGYRLLAPAVPVVVWSGVGIALLLATMAWLAVVNLLYVVTQIVVAATGKAPLAALATALAFIRARRREVMRAFFVVMLFVVLATFLSLLAIAGLSLIAFVPIAGFAVIPIQLGAAFLRSLLYQFLGLTAVGAYLALFRRWAVSRGLVAESDAGPAPLFIDNAAR
jgi:hypothetical protein